MGRKGWHIVQVPASARGEKAEKQREGKKVKEGTSKLKLNLDILISDFTENLFISSKY